MLFHPDPKLREAACRDLPEGAKRRFFTARIPTSQAARELKAVCSACPVKDYCLETALEFESAPGERRYGIWGGLTADERNEIYGDKDLQAAGVLA